jgi:peroxiredoxin
VKTAPKAKAGGAKNEELAGGGLQIGDTIPDTTLKNEKEEDVNVKQLAEDGLVMFVVPKADTRAYSLCPIS